jgi:hypothetical protein
MGRTRGVQTPSLAKQHNQSYGEKLCQIEIYHKLQLQVFINAFVLH